VKLISIKENEKREKKVSKTSKKKKNLFRAAALNQKSGPLNRFDSKMKPIVKDFTIQIISEA